MINGADLSLYPNDILGAGGFGIVCAGSLRGTPVVVKLLRQPPTGDTSLSVLSAICNEIRILRQIRHPNVVVFYGAILNETSGEPALVLERLLGPTLHDFLRRHTDLSAQHRYTICLGVCRALCFLHGHKPCVVHGDLKPGNTMITLSACTPVPKLIDFGLSRLLRVGPLQPLGGTVRWMAPEIMRESGLRPSPAADVFSFGCMAYFVLTGLDHLRGWSRETIIKQARAGSLPALEWPDALDGSLLQARQLCDHCCAFEAAARISMPIVLGNLQRLEAGVPDVAKQHRGELQLLQTQIQDMERMLVSREEPLPFSSGVSELRKALESRATTDPTLTSWNLADDDGSFMNVIVAQFSEAVAACDANAESCSI